MKASIDRCGMTTDVELSADSAEQQWQRRLQMARDTHAYQAYLQVRRQVIAQLGLGHDRRSGSNTPSDYWSGELSRFDYMLDASPLVIAKLRHHTHNLTGLLPQHYRGTLDAKRQQFAEKLRSLQHSYLQSSQVMNRKSWETRSKVIRFTENAARLLGPLL